MILAELIRLYHQGDSPDLAPEGFEWKGIPYVLVLDAAGKLCEIENTRDAKGIRRSFLVPSGARRTKGISANVLWDTAEYVLGTSRDGQIERARARHAAFVANVLKLNCQDEGLRAIRDFFAAIPWRELERFSVWPEIVQKNPVLSFRLASDEKLVCSRPAVLNAINRIRRNSNRSDANRGVCIATGKEGSLERVHPWIFGVQGTEQGRGRLISFGQRAFESYGNERASAIQARICKSGASGYATALNRLLSSNSKQKIQMGNLTAVFWDEKGCGFEDVFAQYAGSAERPEPPGFDEWIRKLERYAEGRNRNSRFFALGLAGRGSRISIEFWIAEKVGVVAGAMARQSSDQYLKNGAPPFVSVSETLDCLSLPSGQGFVPDSLSAALVRSLLLRDPYPKAVISRVLLNVGRNGTVDYVAAAILKSFVNRSVADGASRGAKLPLSLDSGLVDIGYMWGRFFAICEFIELKGGPRWAPTLGSRFYRVVCARPWIWFDTLYRGAKRQLLRNRAQDALSGLDFHLESVADVIRSFDRDAANLDQEGQARFGVGFFQQLQELR
jgi:CRISPR-associated protein Csd1